MSKTAVYDIEKVDAVGQSLNELAKQGPRTLSIRLAIERLHPQILELLGRGWSVDGVATELSHRGIAVTARTLKNILAELAEAPQIPPVKKRSRAAKAAPAETPVPVPATAKQSQTAPLPPATQRSHKDV